MGMTKNITASLSTLRTGMEVVGSGDLGHRIGLPSQDELGDLARSFDGMTEHLQAVTVSKNTLQQEIEVRKHAEEALRESEARFRLLSETASRLLVSPDPQGIVNSLCRQVMTKPVAYAQLVEAVKELVAKYLPESKSVISKNQ
jgi:methyl-accepting chemotaxis protein